MIIDFKELGNIREKHREDKLVFCAGVFDLLHTGHLEHLKNSKEKGNVLVVAVSSDKRAKNLKGKNRPVHNQYMRVIMVDAVRHVDYAFIAPEPSDDASAEIPTVQILKILKPDILVVSDPKGFDYTGYAKDLGVDLIKISRSTLDSTTDIIERVKKI